MERVIFSSVTRAVLILTLMASPACAFKQDEPAKAAVSALPSGAVQLDGGGSRTLTRTADQVWKSDLPIFVNSDPGDKLTLHFQIPSSVQAQARQVTAKLGAAEAATALAVTWSPEESGIAVTLHGIAGLPKDQDASTPISIHLWAEGSAEERIELSLRTPPDAPRLISLTIRQWRAYGRPLARGREHLSSGDTSLSLLQIIEVTHPADLAVAISAPIRLAGTLSTRATNRAITQARCSISTSETQTDDILSDALYLLPLTDDLQDRLSDLLSGSVSEKPSLTAIEPGKSVLYGLYATGDRAKPVSDSGFKPHVYDQTSVVSSCHTTCGNGGQWDASWNPYADNFWRGQGFPAGSSKCDATDCIPGDPKYNAEACTQCALWEQATGETWWDFNRRFCFALQPGDGSGHGRNTDPWSITPVNSLAPSGRQDGPLMLRIDETSRSLGVRFLGNALTENAPLREIPDALAAQSVQAPGATGQ